MARKSLESAHGIFDLNSDMETLLNELEDQDFQKVDCKKLVTKTLNLMNTNRLALRRILLYSSSCVMVCKGMAREELLTRFYGKQQLKEALQFSDFGTPDLFGPLNAEMAENVRMYRTHNNKEWRMSLHRDTPLSKRKASGSLTTPPYKKRLTSSVPVSSAVSSPLQQGGKKQFSKNIFREARGKSRQRRGKGRGGRGK